MFTRRSTRELRKAQMGDDHADDLLRRALIDEGASAAVALRVAGLPLCDTLTVVFHGRRDLGTIQTYVTHGGRGAGDAVSADELLRVPCDLDLAAAEDRGPPADGHRLRAAGRRARLPAARRPRALPGGLPRPRRRPRPRDGRAARPPGDLGAALPRALRRRLLADGVRMAAVRRRPQLFLAIGFAVFVFLGISFLLARGL